MAQLKEHLRQRGFCTQGNKSDLIECLLEIVHKKEQQTGDIDMTKTGPKKEEKHDAGLVCDTSKNNLK